LGKLIGPGLPLSWSVSEPTLHWCKDVTGATLATQFRTGCSIRGLRAFVRWTAPQAKAK
jgi:hypothetical protein